MNLTERQITLLIEYFDKNNCRYCQHRIDTISYTKTACADCSNYNKFKLISKVKDYLNELLEEK